MPIRSEQIHAVIRALSYLKPSSTSCNDTSEDLFAPIFFSDEQLESGAVVIHVLVTLYIFAILAYICEHFFVPAIEHFAHDFNIPSNIAGASLMAAGASLPQLANTLIGLFLAHDDIGVGAVVGSAFFSVLLIPGLCGIVHKGTIQLTCLPIMRDCITYVFASILLGLCVADGIVTWYEALCLILAYVVYLLVLALNGPLERWLVKTGMDPRGNCVALACKKHSVRGVCCVAKERDVFSRETERSGLVETSLSEDKKNYEATSSSKKDSESGVENTIEKKEVSPAALEQMSIEEHPQDPDPLMFKSKEDEALDELMTTEREYHSVLAPPQNKWYLPLYIVMLPALIVLYLTIPDFRRPGCCWRRLYGLTLFVCVIYIALTAYVLVWMISILGDVMGVSSTIMGMTLLAVGGSIPDAFNSVFATRDGFSGMALANCMGSINFDILFCLGLPWLLMIVTNDGHDVVLSDNLVLVIVCLLASGVFIILTYVFSGFTINKISSAIFILAYIGFLAVAVFSTTESGTGDKC